MAELAFTVREAAEALGLSPRTVYELVYNHTIPHTRVQTGRGKGKAGKILIPRPALEAWLAGAEAGGGGARDGTRRGERGTPARAGGRNLGRRRGGGPADRGRGGWRPDMGGAGQDQG